MGPQIIVSAHAPVEITKTHRVGLRYAVLEAGVCFGVFNGMKGQIIQRKTAIQGIEVSLNYYYYHYYYYYYYTFFHSRIITKITIYNNVVVKIYETNKTTTT